MCRYFNCDGDVNNGCEIGPVAHASAASCQGTTFVLGTCDSGWVRDIHMQHQRTVLSMHIASDCELIRGCLPTDAHPFDTHYLLIPSKSL
jgi:hypothetical protein